MMGPSHTFNKCVVAVSVIFAIVVVRTMFNRGQTSKNLNNVHPFQDHGPLYAGENNASQQPARFELSFGEKEKVENSRTRILGKTGEEETKQSSPKCTNPNTCTSAIHMDCCGGYTCIKGECQPTKIFAFTHKEQRNRGAFLRALVATNEASHIVLMKSGERISSGETLTFTNGIELKQENDGNLALYVGATLLWETGQHSTVGDYFTQLQRGDGNFITWKGSITSKERVIWKTQKVGPSGSYFFAVHTDLTKVSVNQGEPNDVISEMWSAATLATTQPTTTLAPTQAPYNTGRPTPESRYPTPLPTLTSLPPPVLAHTQPPTPSPSTSPLSTRVPYTTTTATVQPTTLSLHPTPFPTLLKYPPNQSNIVLMKSGERISSGETLTFTNGIELKQENDGNLALYVGATLLWETGQHSTVGDYFTQLQRGDGNFITWKGSITSKERVIWSSQKVGPSGSYFFAVRTDLMKVSVNQGEPNDVISEMWSAVTLATTQPTTTLAPTQEKSPAQSTSEPSTGPRPAPPTIVPPEELSFYMIADTPYTPREAEQLKIEIANLNRRHKTEEAKFLVHLGDIMSAKTTKCEENAYEKADSILKLSEIPVLITPGDNEVIDCPIPRDGWARWKKYFHNYDEKHWQGHSVPIERQKHNPENFAIFQNGILILGIHMQGGKPDDLAEFRKQQNDNLEWTRSKIGQYKATMRTLLILSHARPNRRRYKPKGHFDYFDPAVAEINKLGLAKDNIMYICGDTHKYLSFSISDGVPAHTPLKATVLQRGPKAVKIRIDTQGKINILR